MAGPRDRPRRALASTRRTGATRSHPDRVLDRGPYQQRRFAAELHREATFGGFTVPTQVTAGYDDDSPDWPDCAFIEITVDDASYI